MNMRRTLTQQLGPRQDSCQRRQAREIQWYLVRRNHLKQQAFTRQLRNHSYQINGMLSITVAHQSL